MYAGKFEVSVNIIGAEFWEVKEKPNQPGLPLIVSNAYTGYLVQIDQGIRPKNVHIRIDEYVGVYYNLLYECKNL